MTDTVFRMVAAIARDLRHGCAIEDAVAFRTTTLESLHREFESQADFVDANSEGPDCVRWEFVEYHDGKRLLRHTTGTGRMVVTADNDVVFVTINSRPTGSTEGSTVCTLEFNFRQKPGEPACKTKVLFLDPALLADRHDRVSLLTKRCFHALHELCTMNAIMVPPDEKINTLAIALRRCLIDDATYRYEQALIRANELVSDEYSADPKKTENPVSDEEPLPPAEML